MGACITHPQPGPQPLNGNAVAPSPSPDLNEIRQVIQDELKKVHHGPPPALGLSTATIVRVEPDTNPVPSLRAAPTTTLTALSSASTTSASALNPSTPTGIAGSGTSGLLDPDRLIAVYKSHQHKHLLRLTVNQKQLNANDPHNPITYSAAIVTPTVQAGVIPRIAGLSNSVGDATGYKWAYYDDKDRYYPDIPGHCAKLSLIEQFDLSKIFHIAGDALQSGIDLMVKNFKIDDFDRWLHPQRYVDFFQYERDRNTMSGHSLDALISLPLPSLSHSWQHDEVWASQFLQGTNPVMVRLVTEAVKYPVPSDPHVRPPPPLKAGPLPADFALDDTVKARIESITGGVSIETLAKNKRLFVIDFAALKSCPLPKDRVLYAPIALFYTDRRKVFQPLCIQLRRDGADAAQLAALDAAGAPDAVKMDRTIYYPDDTNQVVWTLVKMLVGNADSNYHEAITHLGFTHLLMEPIAIAADRSFHSDHRIYQFLAPHFNRTLWINDKARDTLISPSKGSGSLESFSSMGVDGTMHLLNEAYKNFDFLRDTSLPEALKYRGVDDAAVIPQGYFYRDYGLWVWQAMYAYVATIVEAAYPLTEKLTPATDPDLANFLSEVNVRGRLPTFPIAIPNTTEQYTFFTNLLTCILWTGSAQHAAVNFPQYDYHAFLPMKPLYMQRPSIIPPQGAPQTVTWPYITKALAGMTTTIESIFVAKTLTSQWSGDIHLETERDHPKLSFFKLDTIAFPSQYQQFVLHLKDVEDKMRTANNTNGTNYEYLYPSQIPASVSI